MEVWLKRQRGTEAENIDQGHGTFVATELGKPTFIFAIIAIQILKKYMSNNVYLITFI